jgi:hypothetical protein
VDTWFHHYVSRRKPNQEVAATICVEKGWQGGTILMHPSRHAVMSTGRRGRGGCSLGGAGSMGQLRAMPGINQGTLGNTLLPGTLHALLRRESGHTIWHVGHTDLQRSVPVLKGANRRLQFRIQEVHVSTGPESGDGRAAKIPGLREDGGGSQAVSGAGCGRPPSTAEAVGPSGFCRAGGSVTPGTSLKLEDLIWRGRIGQE